MKNESGSFWIRLFSRETATGYFMPEVDGLRFIAIAAVLLHHVTAAYLRTTHRLGSYDLPRQWWDVFPKSTTIALGYAGHIGVHLFFVLSGVILALPYARSYREATARPRLVSYYARRLVRLDPPYVLNLLIAFVIIRLSNIGWSQFPAHLIASMFYLHGPIYGQASWVNGIAWSLEVEVQFYLVMPLLALLLAIPSARIRRGVLLVLTVGMAFVAQRFISYEAHPRLQLSLINYLHFFFAGFLLADLYQANVARIYTRRFAWDALALLASAGIYVILTRRYEFYYLTPLLITVLYIGLFLGRCGHAFITRPWVVIIGGMCYTIYLYHFIVIDLLSPYTMSWASAARPLSVDLLLQCALLIPAILVTSAVLFLSVEKPFMHLSRLVGQRLHVFQSRARN